MFFDFVVDPSLVEKALRWFRRNYYLSMGGIIAMTFS